MLPKKFSGWFLAKPHLPRRCWWCQHCLCTVFSLGTRHISVRVLWFWTTHSEIKALWCCFVRFLVSVGIPPFPGGQISPEWSYTGTAVTAPSGKHRAVAEIHTGLHSRQRRDDPGETPGEFRKQSYCTSDQLCLFLQQILWNTIDFKLNSSLVYGRHTNLPEISESFTSNLTESLLVSLLMINSPGLVWERKILPALTQDVSFFLSQLQSYNSLWPQDCCSVKAVM